MCGIFAYSGKRNNAGKLILEGLKSLEYRGYDSWGIVLKKTTGELFIKKEIGKIGDSRLPKFTTQIGIGHTRWATHGNVTAANSHPHLDCNQKIIVVHNGIVENFEILKKQLLKKGHFFLSETDTEVIAHLLEEKGKTSPDFKKNVLEVFKMLSGMNAIVVFYPESEEFYAIKSGSPLAFGKNEKQQEIIFSSDASTILPYTNKVYFLDDNELLSAGREHYQLFNLHSQPKTIKFTQLNYDVQETHLGEYPNFMIKEINEQPKVLANILTTQKTHLEKIAQQIKTAYGTYLIGCGSAYVACIAGTYIFSKVARRHLNAAVASEFTYQEDFITDKSLLIAFSQSGETIDIISAIKKTQTKNTPIIAITNVLGSTLYRLADEKILLHAGPEKCVVATKSFTAKIAIIYLLAHILNNSYLQGSKNLKKAILEITQILKNSTLQKLADQLQNKKHVYILGRGVSYAAALESAIKIKEVSYIHAEAFPAGELKHGIIALIEKASPVIIFNPQDETYADTLSSAYEVKARGAYVIGVSSINNPVYDLFIQVKNCEEATLIPNVIIAQLIGYYLALAKGLDPDKPRNLAKSVTVK